MNVNHNQLRDIILSLNTPHVIKQFPGLKPWKCFNISLEEWCTLLDAHHSNINFETGNRNKSSDKPQWEYCRKTMPMKCSEFYSKYKNSKNDDDIWASYGYKSINVLPDSCKDGISFTEFGFNDIDTDDISFWLGSKGAHTSCHFDTYGCNIVVQVYGR